MIKNQFAVAVVAISLVCGCGGGTKPNAHEPVAGDSQPASTNPSPSIAVLAEPPLESVPDQTEPGDADFPRGAEAFAELVKAAQANDGDAWSKSEAKLQALGAHATAALAARLTDENPVARELAAMFLAQIGPEAASTATGLVKLLQDDSNFARVNAAAALSTFEGFTEQVAPVLTELLEDGDDNVRLTAATSLRNLGPAAAPAVAGLAGLLSDPNPQIRIAAATTLGEIGPAATKSLPALRKLGRDPDPAVLAAASRAIRQIDETARPKVGITIPASATE